MAYSFVLILTVFNLSGDAQFQKEVNLFSDAAGCRATIAQVRQQDTVEVYAENVVREGSNIYHLNCHATGSGGDTMATAIAETQAALRQARASKKTPDSDKWVPFYAQPDDVREKIERETRGPAAAKPAPKSRTGETVRLP